MQSTKQPKEIANCVAFNAPIEGQITGAFQTRYVYVLVENPPGIFRIMVDSGIAEATFLPSPSGGTTIELRLSDWIPGTGLSYYGKDKFWSCIEKCATP